MTVNARPMRSPQAQLRARGLSAKKRLGQNFLVDTHIAARIAEAATTPTGGTVLEVGAGLGALTIPLLARAHHVIAIERDPELCEVLRDELRSELESGALHLHQADATALDWRALIEGTPRPRVVAGNLPYLLTGRLIEMATSLRAICDAAVFMVQAEVADRLLAAPASRDYGALSVFVQAAFEVRRVLSVKRGSFFPSPNVDSAVVRLTSHVPARAEETEAFREAVHRAFGMRRKTLRNAWKGIYGWSSEALAEAAEASGIALDARGETLAVEDFARLAARAPRERPPTGAAPTDG